MRVSPLIAILALVLLMTENAQALSLTNRVPNPQFVQIILTAEQPVRLSILMRPDQSIDILCARDCVIVLENGAWVTVGGWKTVLIHRGRFALLD